MPVRSNSSKPAASSSDTTSRIPDGSGTPPPATRSDREARPPVPRTRAGAAWVGIAVALAVLVLLIVFMLQNTDPVEVAFLGLRGTAPLSVTLLIAGVGFAVVTLIVGSLRIGQLRHRIGRGSDGARRPADDRR